MQRVKSFTQKTGPLRFECSDPESEGDANPHFTETVTEVVLFLGFGSSSLETVAVIPIVAPNCGFATTGMVIWATAPLSWKMLGSVPTVQVTVSPLVEQAIGPEGISEQPRSEQLTSANTPVMGPLTEDLGSVIWKVITVPKAEVPWVRSKAAAT
jgi:hypothetical protein